MKALVKEGMELGALGLSTGLMYEPGLFSNTEEVVALALEVKPFAGVYDSHIRNPVHAWIASNEEAITIGERAGIGAKLGHIKEVGLHNAGLVDEMIAIIDAARSRRAKCRFRSVPLRRSRRKAHAYGHSRAHGGSEAGRGDAPRSGFRHQNQAPRTPTSAPS